MELKPAVHAVASFGWAPSEVDYSFSNPHVSILQYTLGIEVGLSRMVYGEHLFKPFVAFGAGGRTYAYADPNVSDNTCTAGYGAVGAELQAGKTAVRLEARGNIYCYQSPIAGQGSETRNDIGLVLGVVLSHPVGESYERRVARQSSDAAERDPRAAALLARRARETLCVPLDAPEARCAGPLVAGAAQAPAALKLTTRWPQRRKRAAPRNAAVSASGMSSMPMNPAAAPASSRSGILQPRATVRRTLRSRKNAGRSTAQYAGDRSTKYVGTNASTARTMRMSYTTAIRSRPNRSVRPRLPVARSAS